MLISIFMTLLASVSSLPFQVTPAIGLASIISTHLGSTPPQSGVSTLPPIDIHHLPHSRTFTLAERTHEFTSPSVILQPEFSKTLKRLLHHSTTNIDLSNLVERMRAIDEQFEIAFDWQEIVYHPQFFIEFVNTGMKERNVGSNLYIGGEAVEQMKHDLKQIHEEIGKPEFTTQSKDLLQLPHTFGMLRDQPVFTSPDVLASPRELISQIKKAAGSYPIPLDLEALVDRMKKVDEEVYQIH
jgi:hypothetical protein